MNPLAMLQLWAFAFAFFAAVASFTQTPYPTNVEKWTKSQVTWQGISIVTVVATSISLFEIYKTNFGGGGGGGGMGY